MATNRQSAKRFFSPRSIVFIGGSNLKLPIRNTLALGYLGEIWVVNPNRDNVAGYPCYASIADLPGVPDAAFVGVNAEVTVSVVEVLSQAGCGGAVCYAAGFAEVGDSGEKLQDALVQAAADMPIIGPNCYGLINATHGFALWPDQLACPRVEEGVAMVSQSGNIALNLTMHLRSLPIAKVISVGNQANFGIADCVDLLLEDPAVTAIGLYIEGLKDVPQFGRIAIKAIERKIPIVALKAGTSEIGTQLTLSHTSSLAGSDELYQALFDRFGVIRVNTPAELLETLKLVSVCAPAQGNRLGVLTCSGGDSALMADQIDRLGLELPELNHDQTLRLSKLLPEFASLSNPLDYNTSIWGDLNACIEVFSVFLSGDFDLGVLVLDFPLEHIGSDEAWHITLDALAAAQSFVNKPCTVISTLPEALPEPARLKLLESGICPLQGLSDGVNAISRWVQSDIRKTNVLAAGRLAELNLRPAGADLADSVVLNEYESKERLARFGLYPPPGHFLLASEVPDAARSIGFPVVVKAVSREMAHKTELNAVQLNLKNSAECGEAAQRMSQTLAEADISIEGFLVEKMLSDSVGELIVGLKRDPQFGLALIIGTGGVLVNLLNDSASLLLPTRRDEVQAKLLGLQGYKLLDGYRGKTKGDITSTVDAIMAVAEFGLAHWDEIMELDINPLLVMQEGQGAFAADALIRLKK